MGAKVTTNLIQLSVAALCGLVGIGLVPLAKAEAIAVKEAPADLHTSSHLGFAVADQSSTGFRAVGGSLVFLDISQSLSRRLELGLRSIGEGGKTSQREFYRLGAGPLLSWHLSSDWMIQGALALFNETGLASDGQKAYQSRGQELMLGWEKSWQMAPRVSVAWGGFVTYHRGGVVPTEAFSSPVVAASRVLNAGLSHGMEAALRLSL